MDAQVYEVEILPTPPKRFRKDIDWKVFENLCALQCTQEEMANIFHMNRENLRIRVKLEYEEEYQAVYDRYSAPGLASLRKNQFSLSKRSATMAIRLGEIWLGQKSTSALLAPMEEDIDLKKKYYEATYKVQQLEQQLNDLKSKASQELQRSDTPIQPVDRSSEFREDIQLSGQTD